MADDASVVESEIRDEHHEDEDPYDDHPLVEAVEAGVMGATFLVGFGLLALGNPWFWIAFPVGFAGALPAASALAKLYVRRRAEAGSSPQPTGEDGALAELRERYARGDLTEDEFERRVERLLETETTRDAAEAAERYRSRQGDERDEESEYDRLVE